MHFCENIAFHISDDLVEAISVELFLKKVLVPVFFLTLSKIAQFRKHELFFDIFGKKYPRRAPRAPRARRRGSARAGNQGVVDEVEAVAGQALVGAV